MKTLYLLRHAKSSRDDASLPDRDRPLNARGERDAAKMSKRWLQKKKKPDLIMSSPATRAMVTAEVIAKNLNYKATHISIDARLYAATKATLIAVIEALDDKLDRVMLVGHNPGFAELAHHFDSSIIFMPTCALAEFRFEATSWAGIGRAKPAHTAFDSPKNSRHRLLAAADPNSTTR
jgi:phosphohistidine phosphatase